MKNTLLLVSFFISATLMAQSPAKWNINGNAATPGDFIGTTNNQPVIFYSNNSERMRLQPNGQLRVNNLGGSGFSVVTVNNTGEMGKISFTTDSNHVLTGAGTFRNATTLGPWQRNGSTYSISSNVGIGTTAPNYPLDVNGNARVNGKLYVYRIVGTTNDSLIRFGDSTVVINHVTGRIYNNSFTAGFGLGQSAFGRGPRSTAIGYRVVSETAAVNAVTIGAGVNNGLSFSNAVPNSLAVAFNSDVPTFFISTASGYGTVGKVGVGTGNPRADFQVGNSVKKITAGPAYAVSGTFSNAYVGFNVARTGMNQWETENDGGGNGGVVMLGDMGGGLRIIGLPSTGATNQNVNDQFIADHTKLYLRNDGRVVIGAETMVNGPRDLPTTLLTVDGSVVCRELFVTQSNWADSIFAPGYVLMPLDSLEEYVNANGHLPGVPAEKDVKANGSNLGQTDVILLTKIEELTLYMLQLQKQNAILQKEIAELKQK